MSNLPESLGQYLRAEREKRGFTLEQIAAATKINLKILYSLEQDQYRDLPVKAFIRGFIVSYCRFIGLSSGETLTKYQSFIEDKLHERPARDEGHMGYAFEKREEETSRVFLWWVMGGFGVAGLIVFLIFKPALKNRNHAHLDKLQKKVMENVDINVQSPKAEVVLPGLNAMSSSMSSSEVAGVLASMSSSGTGGSSNGTNSASAIIAAVNAPVASSPPGSSVASVAAVEIPGAEVASSSSSSEKTDPLNKGDTIPRPEAKYVLSLKAIESVWVRYRSDDLPMTAFRLKGGLQLVIKAKTKIIFEAADPSLLLIRKGADYVPVSEDSAYRTENTRHFLNRGGGEIQPLLNQSALEATQAPIQE